MTKECDQRTAVSDRRPALEIYLSTANVNSHSVIISSDTHTLAFSVMEDQHDPR